MQDPVVDVQSWSRFQQPPSASPTRYTPPVASSTRSTSPEQHQLRIAITSMSDFVSQHMPIESLELVLTLENLTSVEQGLNTWANQRTTIWPNCAHYWHAHDKPLSRTCFLFFTLKDIF